MRLIQVMGRLGFDKPHSPVKDRVQARRLSFRLHIVIRPTTILTFPRLNARVGVEIVLASETFQHTGSFKFRGAWHMASSVPQRHLLGSSSGNFGQALAFACQQLKKRCTVVVPEGATKVKIEAMRELGACVDLIDLRKVSRDARVLELAKQYPAAYLASGFDDDLMIAGNSTLGKELAALEGKVDAIITPISGGGLASGLVVGLREECASIPVIAAEPLLANHVTRSMRAGHRIEDPSESTTIADGARRPSLGKRNWEVLKEGLRDQIEVPERAIREAVRLLFRFANLKVEPTGALAVAGLLVDSKRLGFRRVCCVVSGGNVDAENYAELIVGADSSDEAQGDRTSAAP
jgi:threonine dehydratase